MLGGEAKGSHTMTERMAGAERTKETVSGGRGAKEGLTLAEAPLLRLPVGLADWVREVVSVICAERLMLIVRLAVRVGVKVALMLEVTVLLPVVLLVDVADTLPVALLVRLPVALGEGV